MLLEGVLVKMYENVLNPEYITLGCHMSWNRSTPPCFRSFTLISFSMQTQWHIHPEVSICLSGKSFYYSCLYILSLSASCTGHAGSIFLGSLATTWATCTLVLEAVAFVCAQSANCPHRLPWNTAWLYAESQCSSLRKPYVLTLMTYLIHCNRYANPACSALHADPMCQSEPTSLTHDWFACAA